MYSRNTNRVEPPPKLLENYRNITNSKLIKNKELSDDTIVEFEHLLNEAQPQSDADHCLRSFVQYLYRKNPGHFARFIQRSRLSHLSLWTEAKFMVKTFELRGLVYIKWDVDINKYVCSMHRIVTEYLNSGECCNMAEVVNRITQETEDKDRDNRDNRESRGPRRDFNDNRDTRGPRRDFNDNRDTRGPRRDFNDNRDTRGPRRDFNDRGYDNYRGHNQDQPRIYDNRRSREPHTKQVPTKSDFPVLADTVVPPLHAVWAKNAQIKTPAPSVNGSDSDTNSTATINLSDSICN
jgi:hypothetical protein